MNKALKVFLWIAGILVGLIIVLVIGVQLFFPTEKVRKYAEEEATRVLQRKVTIKDLGVSFWGGLGVNLKDVSIANPEGIDIDTFVFANNIDVKMELLPLLSGEYRVTRLIVNEPIIHLYKNSEGRVNFALDLAAADTTLPKAAREAPPEKQTAAAIVSFDKLEIKNGSLWYRDDSSNVTVDLSGFALETSLKTPSQTMYETKGRISADEIVVTTDEAMPPYQVALDYDAVYDLQRQAITVDRGKLTLNNLSVNVTGTIDHPLDTTTAHLQLRAEKVAVSDVLSLLPPSQRDLAADFSIFGDFSLTTDLQYDQRDTANPLAYSGTATLTDMTMSKSDMPGELRLGRALLDFKKDNLRFALEEATFDGEPLKGHLVVDNFDDPRVSGELAGRFNLVFLEPFIPTQGTHELAGQTDFDVTFSGQLNNPKDMDFTGSVSVTDGRYQSDQLPEPIESFAADVYFDRRLTNVRSFTANFPSGDITFRGRINDLVPYLLADSAGAAQASPSIDGSLIGTINLAMINPFLPDKGDPRLDGSMSMDLTFAGKATDLANFKPRGTVEISNGSYTDSLLPEDITSLSANLRITDDTISVDDFNLSFESSDLAFSGKLLNPFPYLLPIEGLDRSKVKRPTFNFRLTSTTFNVDKLFPEAVPGGGEEGVQGKPEDSVSMVFVPDIDGQGAFEIDTLIYYQMKFTDITGNVRIRDRRIMVQDVTGDVYAGAASGETTIDLNDFEKPKYDGTFQFSQVQASDLLTRFSPLGKHLHGNLNMSGSYSASGWEGEQFLKSLTMDGHGSMKEGEVIFQGAMYQTLNNIAKFANESLDKEQALKDLATKIEVKDGKVFLNDLSTELGDLGELTIGGYYGFDGGLDYNGSILLSDKYSSKLLGGSGLGGQLGNLLGGAKEKRIRLPLTIGGNIDNPSVSLDMDKMKEQMGKNLFESVSDKLLKKD